MQDISLVETLTRNQKTFVEKAVVAMSKAEFIDRESKSKLPANWIRKRIFDKHNNDDGDGNDSGKKTLRY